MTEATNLQPPSPEQEEQVTGSEAPRNEDSVTRARREKDEERDKQHDEGSGSYVYPDKGTDPRAYIARKMGISTALADRILCEQVGEESPTFYLTLPINGKDRQIRLGNARAIKRTEDLGAATEPYTHTVLRFNRKIEGPADFTTALYAIVETVDSIYNEVEETKDWLRGFNKSLQECERHPETDAGKKELHERVSYERTARGMSVDHPDVFASFRTSAGQFFVHLDELRQWIDGSKEVRLSNKELSARLRRLKFEREQVKLPAPPREEGDGGPASPASRWYSHSLEGLEL